MSIAIYAVVKPSRVLFFLTCGMCLGTLAIAGAIGSGNVGELSPVSRVLFGSGCFFVAFSVLYQQIRQRSEFHIHISGSGQIRFAELKPMEVGQENSPPVLAKVETEARLMPASTIWPWLLLLRLQIDAKTVVTVPVLPDCLPADTFRALSVACRWITAHEHSMKH